MFSEGRAAIPKKDGFQLNIVAQQPGQVLSPPRAVERQRAKVKPPHWRAGCTEGTRLFPLPLSGVGQCRVAGFGPAAQP